MPGWRSRASNSDSNSKRLLWAEDWRARRSSLSATLRPSVSSVRRSSFGRFSPATPSFSLPLGSDHAPVHGFVDDRRAGVVTRIVRLAYSHPSSRNLRVRDPVNETKNRVSEVWKRTCQTIISNTTFRHSKITTHQSHFQLITTYDCSNQKCYLALEEINHKINDCDGHNVHDTLPP